MVPPPSDTISNAPKPFGETMSDVLSMKEEDDAKELERMKASCEKFGVIMQPAEMPSPESLCGRRIQLMFEDEEDEDILMWYGGKVLAAEACDEGIDITIEWDGEYEEKEQKETEETLRKEKWVGCEPCLVEWSWRLA